MAKGKGGKGGKGKGKGKGKGSIGAVNESEQWDQSWTQAPWWPVLALQNGSPQVATQSAVASPQAAPNGKAVKGLVRSLGVMKLKPNKIEQPKYFGPECVSEDEISADDEREFPPASSEVAQEKSNRRPIMPRFSRASQALRKKKEKRLEDDIDIDKIVQQIANNNGESERRRLEKAVAQAIVKEATQLEASEAQSRLLEKRTMV